MIVDAHYHLEPAHEPVERLLREMDRLGIRQTALIASLSEPFQLSPLGLKRWVSMCKGLVGARPEVGDVRYRMAVRRSGRVAFAGRGIPIYPRPDNDVVERAMARHPGRLLGWVCVNPAAGLGADEVERRLSRPGWIGVKAHPYWHQYPVQELEPIAEVCQARRRPMLIHLGPPGERGDFRRLPERFPRLPVVYAHALIPWYRRAWQDARRLENVFVDLSSPYLDRALRRAALQEMGPARCIYGTDGPYGYPAADGMYDRGVILGQIEQFGLSSPDLDRVLGGNFHAITAA